MTFPTLTPAARKAHRAAAHHLEPVVMVGADGLSDAVLAEADRALAAHGLIKMRVLALDRAARDAMLAELAERLGAAPVQHIGRLLVLWRPRPQAETSATGKAPPARRAAPRVVTVVKASKSPTHRPQVTRVTVLGNQRLTAGGLVRKAKARPQVRSAKKRAMRARPRPAS